MKKLLLITSEKIGDTGTVSFSYIFHDNETYDKYPEQCSGLFGMVKETDNPDTFYINAFKGGRGIQFAAPITEDFARNKEIVDECFPDNFNLLCTSKVAEKIKPLLESCDVQVDVVFSEETLLTS